MPPRVLLDTHVLVRCLAEAKKLSRAQSRILTGILQRHEVAAVSAITLLEIAMRAGQGMLRISAGWNEILEEIGGNPMFQILPLTVDVAREASLLRDVLRDPADCVIVATARVHGLRLLTSDQRIVASHTVSTVD